MFINIQQHSISQLLTECTCFDQPIDRHTAAIKLEVKNTNSIVNDLSDMIQLNPAIDLGKYNENYIRAK